MNASEICINQFSDDYSVKFKKSTIDGYKITIRQLITFSQKPYDQITTREIRNWFLYLEENDYKPGTIRRKLFGLRVFYHYCMEEGFITYNPVDRIPIPKETEPTPHYLTYEQLTQLRSLCEGNVKQRAVMEVLYSTGVRLFELTHMKIEDIDWEERMIHIPNGKGKKERIVYFTKECAEHLMAYLDSRCDELPYLFLNRYKAGSIDKRAIQYWFTSYREKMGIYFTPHSLRHTFAAHLAMKGMSLLYIQNLLGHDNPQHTRIYARLHGFAQKQKYDEWM
jgi:site-specific recombinase XerD